MTAIWISSTQREYDKFINWRENSPAGGVLGAPHRISAADPPDAYYRSPRLVDLDGDGDRDVIAYSSGEQHRKLFGMRTLAPDNSVRRR